MNFVSLHRGKKAVQNDTKHEWVRLSVSEIEDHATYFPNVPRIQTFAGIPKEAGRIVFFFVVSHDQGSFQCLTF